jgi:hypothetical protein
MNNNYNVKNPRLTRGEYWLLESVVEFPIRLNFLSHKHLGEALNKEPHGMDKELLIETLFKLQNNGLIKINKWDTFKKTKRKFILNKIEITQAIDEPKTFGNITSTSYQLTKLGGQVWEAFAQPNWDRFINTDYCSPAKNNLKEKYDFYALMKGCSIIILTAGTMNI